MTEQRIVAYTEQVAVELAHRCAGKPFDELRVWVRIAHQREAMVTKLYDLAHIDGRLGEVDAGAAAAVVRAAVKSIGAHETSHTNFLGKLREDSESLARLAELQGKLEGWVTRSAVSGGVLGRMLIAIGASLNQVPDFARELRQMDLRKLVEFCGELETTARLGYLRMLELQRALAGDEDVQDVFGFAFDFDVAKILCEENFHEAAFHEIRHWVAADGASFQPIPREECARSLHRLAEQHLSVEAARRTTPAIPKGVYRDEDWVSDGGLGELFARYELPVHVAPMAP
jgi:hypothetical protein